MNDDLKVLYEILEYDWVVTDQGGRLHHSVRVEDPEEFQDDAGGLGATSCGLHQRLSIPGIFSRMGLYRCVRCCRAVGYPRGKGSPKNDKNCSDALNAHLEGGPHD